MWFEESVFYQIYILGFCDAPRTNDRICINRIKKINEWISHFNKLGINAIYFTPIFQSESHGYDTIDFFKLDNRLGSDTDFTEVVNNLHNNNIKVILDGVFNHVGRKFLPFQDVMEKREASIYKDWFYIDFNRNSIFNDGFFYEGWEGHYELVKLNLKNPAVCEHIFSAIKKWTDEYKIDGLRLDVAYCLDKDFLIKLHNFCANLKSEFVLIGEILFGDYNCIVNEQMLNSCTNYECYKGIHSSFNDMNMFEISYSLNRQFGNENWTLYKGKHLLSFVDNHDVTRIASLLKDEKNISNAYALLYTMPAVPCIYYGSEWGVKGLKSDGDNALRPFFEMPSWNELTDFISKLSQIHKSSKALCYGSLKNILVTNHQYVFERTYEDERIIVIINADLADNTVNININSQAVELISNEKIQINGTYFIKANNSVILKIV